MRNLTIALLATTLSGCVYYSGYETVPCDDPWSDCDVDTHPGDCTDSDGDRLCDDQELDEGTRPWDEDTDDDGLLDGDELDAGTDPLDPDTDGDGLLDGDERDAGTDPLDPDTDDDGATDAEELDEGRDPLDSDDGTVGPDDDGCERWPWEPEETADPEDPDLTDTGCDWEDEDLWCNDHECVREFERCGCSSAPVAPAGALGLLLGLVALARRRH